MKTEADAIVIGGGAAGLFCAAEAAKRGRSVLLLEGADRIGRKILISGGGRCNFTNLRAGPDNYLSHNPDFCRSALARFTPRDFIDLVERRGIAYREEEQGRLFCRGSAEEIVRMLAEECRAAGARIMVAGAAAEIEKSDLFTVRTDRGAFRSRALVVATGGYPPPRLGEGGFGYSLARRFGLAVVPTRPGLVPLVWNRSDRELFGDLAGISLDASVSAGEHAFRDAFLFTHRGLSGPAVLRASSYWETGKPLLVDLRPGIDLEDEVPSGGMNKSRITTLLRRRLPRRLADAWLRRTMPSEKGACISPRDAREVLGQLHRWRIEPSGTEGYATAEVTVGGVDTADFSSKTMECRKVPGLFFIGEVLDVTGDLGGFNLQWAWSSAFAAGQAL
jgi:hypothetical protein